jgi:hypothetical protein
VIGSASFCDPQLRAAGLAAQPDPLRSGRQPVDPIRDLIDPNALGHPLGGPHPGEDRIDRGKPLLVGLSIGDVDAPRNRPTIAAARPITLCRFTGRPLRASILTGISPCEATNRRRLFSRRKISALAQSHRRAAFSGTESNTD